MGCCVQMAAVMSATATNPVTLDPNHLCRRI